MSQVSLLWDEMKRRFDPSAASGMDNTFQYDINGQGSWLICIKEDTCEIVEGGSDDADVTLSMSLETLEGVINGSIDGMQAFMTGAVTAEGNIMLAPGLVDLFPQAE